jgi:hypothetical protein
MATFSPAGNIRIGRVPFDNSYRHTVTFASRAEQVEEYLGKCTKTYQQGTYTYIRMNNSIKVQANAEELYTYNYCMYQNSNYNTRWFFAFITEVNYINENTTELVLELDVMQTWYYDMALQECYVEREHIWTDTIGANLVAEPPMQLLHESIGSIERKFNADYAVFLINSWPYYNVSQSAGSGSVPVAGGFMNGTLNACRHLIYDLSSSQSISMLKQDMDMFNGVGAAEAITDAFTADEKQMTELLTFQAKSAAGDSTSFVGRYMLRDGQATKTSTERVNLPENFDGYVPKNNKLFTFPFCYCEVGDYTGKNSEFRFEFGGGDHLGFEVKLPLCADAEVYITPQDYNGYSQYAYPNPFVANVSNRISWTYSAYQNWAAQNSVVNQLAALGSVGAATLSVVPGIGAASKALGAGAGAVARNAAKMYPKGGSAAYESRAMSARIPAALRTGAENIDAGQAAMGIGGLAATIGNIDRMSRMPNEAMGSTGGNSRFQAGKTGYYLTIRRLTREFAEIVDQFFSMYGYATDRVKVPNVFSRKAWNYVKTANACMTGNCPSPHIAAINSILDSGITFWHTWDVGNYELDNSLM